MSYGATRVLHAKIATSLIESFFIQPLCEMPRLAEASRERAIGMLDAGWTLRNVARAFGCCERTIRRLRQRVADTGSTKDRPRSGRPRVTSERTDRRIVREHIVDPFRSATATAAAPPGMNNARISYRTVIRRLRERDIRPHRAYVGVELTANRRANRLAWGRNHSNGQWRQGQWRRVVFSDESRFKLSRKDGRMRVYRRRGERFATANVQQVDRYGGGSVMVWGAIRFGWKSRLVVVDGNLTAQRYIDEILRNDVTPHFANNPNDIFMQDNARPHAARLTQQYLQVNNVNTLPWPPYSPDMNPIEHLWDHLDRRIRKRQLPPATLAQMRQAIVEEWNAYPQHRINRLVMSMQRRLRSMIASRGGHTRY